MRGNWIRILYNYLLEFKRIRTSDCVKPLMWNPPDRISDWTAQFVFGQMGLISSLSQPA
jgi:hypothetical protein